VTILSGGYFDAGVGAALTLPLRAADVIIISGSSGAEDPVVVGISAVTSTTVTLAPDDTGTYEITGELPGTDDVIFVSNSGLDTNSGSQSQPLKTLTKARDVARLDKTITQIVIRAGTYRLKDEPTPGTIALINSDDNVTWKAAAGETVEISGGSVVTDWVAEGTAGVFVGDAIVSGSGTGAIQRHGKSIIALNGVPQQQNRFPKWDPGGPGLLETSYTQDDEKNGYLFADTAGGTEDFINFREADLDSSFNNTNCPQIMASAWAEDGWAQRFFPVTVDHATNRLTYSKPGDNPSQDHDEGDRFWVENIPYDFTLAPLNEGEYYLDLTLAKLYFKPRVLDNFVPATDQVTIPRYDMIFSMTGCTGVNFEDINFTDTRLKEDPFQSAVSMLNCTDCHILRGSFKRCGQAVSIAGSNRCQVAGVSIQFNGGVSLDIRNAAFDGSSDNQNWYCAAVGNDFQDTALKRQHDPTVKMKCEGGIVRYNRFRRMNSNGMSLHDGLAAGGIAEYNDINDFGRQMDDSGAAIYGFGGVGVTAPAAANWLVRYNTIRTPGGLRTTPGTNGTFESKTGTGVTIWCIYADNNCVNWIIYGNFIDMRSVDENGAAADIGFAPVHINDSSGCIILNNIMVNGPQYPLGSSNNSDSRGQIWLRNIVRFTRVDGAGLFNHTSSATLWRSNQTISHENFYFNPNQTDGLGAPYTNGNAFPGSRTLIEYQSNDIEKTTNSNVTIARGEQGGRFSTDPELTNDYVVGSATLIDPDIGFQAIDGHLDLAGTIGWDGKLEELRNRPNMAYATDVLAHAQGSW